tara:strand:- start:838 stop:2082 length:1245 start_codon:yes stop_codon:yes gene_type:complete
MALTSQQQAIQNQINAFDSNTGTQVLLSTLLRAINAGDIRQGYADSAAFPINDSDFIGFIGFDEFDSDLRYIGRDLATHKIDSAQAPPPGIVTPVFMGGTSYGYNIGEFQPGGAYNIRISRYSFTSDGNAVSQGNLANTSPHPTYKGNNYAVSKSETHTYVAGGNRGYPPSNINSIQKFPFANNSGGSTITSTLTTTRSYGNMNPLVPQAKDNMYFFHMKNAEKMPTAADDATLTDLGSIHSQPYSTPGLTGASNGYSAHIHFPNGWPYRNNDYHIYPFANDTSQADLSPYGLLGSWYAAPASGSSTHFYLAGGINYDISNSLSAYTNIIQKIGFANNADATDVGDMNGKMYGSSGSSSDTHGYNAGGTGHPGHPGGGNYFNYIQKYSHSSDGNATDVGDLVGVSGTHTKGSEV